jgi:hypothetical protein
MLMVFFLFYIDLSIVYSWAYLFANEEKSRMLAYVFWHWHNSQIGSEAYQEALKGFHQILSEHKPAGFHYSRVLQMERFPWLGREEETYEDWYIVENMAALDPLNEGAVGGVRLEPHNRVARWTEGGTAGLYKLRAGEERLPLVCFSYRFNKPAGMSYVAFYDLLRPMQEQQSGNLWIRQMTLGPGPEFCWQSAEETALPDVLQATKLSVQQIWLTTP